MSVETEQQTTLPSGWEWISIGETGDYINGFAFKPGHRAVSGLPIVRIQNLTDETKPLNTTTVRVPDHYKIDTGDMLMSWSATLDVFAWRRGPALVNQHIFKVVPEERAMLKGLLFHWLKRAIQQLQKTDHLHGSTMMHINRGPFMAHLVPLPPRAEQTRIVAKLEELLSDLDAGVAELKAAQKKLAQYRQSLLKAAVEGALTAKWRAKNTPSETGAQLLERILTERRARWEAKQLAKFKDQGKTLPRDWQKKYPEPVQPDTTDLPGLPQGWVWASAEMLFSWGSGDFLPASAQIDGCYPVYGGNGINGNHNKANVDHSTIVIGRVGVHCGNVYLTESSAWVTDNAIYATSKHDRITWPYAELVMQAARLGSSSKGGAQPFISQKILNDTFVALPPIEEQGQICDEYRSGLNTNVEMERNINHSLKQSTAQRQNILRAAFAGQLVPQDPTDEPASALLERIRAERAAKGTAKLTRSRKPKEKPNA